MSVGYIQVVSLNKLINSIELVIVKRSIFPRVSKNFK
ncbi:hypothetical protein BH10BAC2_BH10BAC2_14920 [soil metagenome]